MAAATHTLSGGDSVSVELPENLREAPELVSGDIALAAVAEPWPWPESFRPRLIIETQPLAPDSATVPQLSSRLIADLLARGAHVVACDIWMVPGQEPGRRIISLFPANDNTIVRMQYVAIRGGRSILLTTEYGAGDHIRGSALFSSVVGSLRYDGEYASPDPDPATMPRLDPFLLEQGTEVEDLSRVRAAQPYGSAGPPVPQDQIDALQTGKLRRADTDILEARGFVSRRGRLTEAGEGAHQALESPARHVTAEVVGDGDLRVARLDILQRYHASVILADPPLGAEAAGRTLDLVATATTPIALARWLGVAPAWTITVTDGQEMPLRLQAGVIEARLTSPEAPPPEDAVDGLVHMWAQPWQIITLRADRPVERASRVIATPEAGYFRLEQDDEARGVTLTPLPSALFLLDILWYGGLDLSRG